MKRSPGRPPVDDEDDSVRVGVTLPAKRYDEYAKRAIREEVSVPEIIRRELDAQRQRE